MDAFAEEEPGSGRLDRFDVLMRGAVAMLAVELVDIGIGLIDPDGDFESDGNVPALMLDAIEPVEDNVDVRGMARFA